VRIRLAVARVLLLFGGRRREIVRLFTRTAAAFGSHAPPQLARAADDLLAEYAFFTRTRVEDALTAGEDLEALDQRLFEAAFSLGSEYRLRLDLRTFADAMVAARLLYRGIGIDFRGSADGSIVVRRCSFASVYSPEVCVIVSALDRGLIAGLTGGGVLRFRERLTAGAPACLACVTGHIGAPKAIVVGTGAGGAAAARELQGPCNVTILEAGRRFRPLSLSVRWMERLRNTGLLFDERVIRLVFPPMRVRRARDGMVLVNGVAAGGTTVLSTGNGLRMDQSLQRIGVNLDREFDELSEELPLSTAHQPRWSTATQRLFEICRDKGLAPVPTPKLVDEDRCQRCGRCVLGCPNGAKWDSRRFLDDAVASGADLRCGYRVTKVVIRGDRAIGVQARVGARTVFLPADLVVLAAGGAGTPVILESSGIRCEPRLFVDPVLCVAAPWPQSMQHHEVPMPFVVQMPGYIVSPYFDYLSFLFNRAWRLPAGRILGLMVKLADSERGTVPDGRGRLDKGLTARDRARLKEAEALCRQILTDFGVDPASIFTGTLNAGHPGGMLPLTSDDAETLHPQRLPRNLYVADASLFPQSLGNPPILTILALARRVARSSMKALFGLEQTTSAPRSRCSGAAC